MALYQKSKIIIFEDNSKALINIEIVVEPVSYTNHIVKDEETLFNLALLHYQSTKDWYKIAEINDLVDPIELVTGDTLIIGIYD